MQETLHEVAYGEGHARITKSGPAGGSYTYAEAGVDTAEGARAVDAIKEAVHSRTARGRGDIGGFGGLFSFNVAKGMEDPLLVSGTDGVGTKLKVAQLVGKHDTVGIDLVAMCVNDILASGAEPLFFLDYIAIGKLKSEHVAEVVAASRGLPQAGCALIGGEMAEHPGVMDPDDYDLSGFSVGVVDRPKCSTPKASRKATCSSGLLRPASFQRLLAGSQGARGGEKPKSFWLPLPSSMANRLATPLSPPPAFT